MTKSNYSTPLVQSIFEKIINEVDAGIHAIDEHGTTIIYNEQMMKMESMEKHDVLHKNLLDVFMFQDNQESTLVKALREGKTTINVKQTYFNNKGKEITTINNTFPIIDDGKIKGAVEIAKDVTQLEKLIRENNRHRESKMVTFEQIIGSSTAIQDVVNIAKRATRTPSSVLIVGDTGTGKELFAQSIHNGSSRSAKPFISQNCAAIPDTLMESLLFGTVRGAFTGSADQPGLFEQANGGTLLLDEINSLPTNLQAKLLRVLQEKTIRRIGDTKERTIDVRIIANMNEDPIDTINENRLRKDLYYRLGVVTLQIPPLRERKEDIPELVQTFIQKYNDRFQMEVMGIDERVMSSFSQYEWPGNVRELEHVIEGAMNLMIGEEEIHYHHLPFQYQNRFLPPVNTKVISQVRNEDQAYVPLKKQLLQFEAHCIKEALEHHEDNISQTAKALGMSRQSLQYRMRRLNITK